MAMHTDIDVHICVRVYTYVYCLSSDHFTAVAGLFTSL